jgi:hypothetical protein
MRRDDACNKKELDAEKNDKVKARIYTSLLYRHWNRWQGPRRSHLMVVPVSGGPPKDLTPGALDVPPFSLGGGDDYAISPDGAEVCYAANADAVPATSTNSDLYAVSMAAARRARSPVIQAPTTGRSTRRMASIWLGARRSGRAMKATAGGCG